MTIEKDNQSSVVKTPENMLYRTFSQKTVIGIQPPDSNTTPRAEAVYARDVNDSLTDISTDTGTLTDTDAGTDTLTDTEASTDTGTVSKGEYKPKKKYVTDAEERALKMERTLLAIEPYLKLKYSARESFSLIMGKNKGKLPAGIYNYKQFHLYKCQDDVLDEDDSNKRFYSFQIEALSSSMDGMARENLFDGLRVKDPEYTKLALKVGISGKDFQGETVIRVKGPDHGTDQNSILQNTMHLLGDGAVDADYEEVP